MWMDGIFHRPIGVATAIAVAALFSLSATAADILVPGDHSTIQAAIDAAAAGDRVIVAHGVWSGDGNRDLVIGGKAITLTAAEGEGNSVIDAGGSEADPHRAFDLSHGEGRDTVIRGFTIRGGQATGDFSQDDGGGVRLRNSSPSIFDCIFFENRSGGAGGGIACMVGSHPLIEGCTFNGNSGFDGGGAIGCDSSSPEIRANLIIWNGAYLYGGAIMCYQGSSPQIIGNMIVENTSKFGGGISCHLDSSPLVVDNVVSGNSAVHNGGGMFFASRSSPEIRNNLVYGNASTGGGGFYFSYWTGPDVVNCTVFNNVATYGGGIGGRECGVTLDSSILWGNQADAGAAIHLSSVPDPAFAEILYTDIQGGDNAVYMDGGVFVTWGPGNISADPLFIRGPDGSCYLGQTAAGQGADSPCLDAGDPALPSPAGTTRTDQAPDRGVGDLGYHHQADWTAVCDLDGSGRVDGGDLSILARAWGAADGESRYDPRADINGSGVVDGDDLALLASVFGQSH